MPKSIFDLSGLSSKAVSSNLDNTYDKAKVRGFGSWARILMDVKKER